MSSEPMAPRAPALPGTEKGFYLEEFHGKTVAIAVPASELRDPSVLTKVVDELNANGTWVALFSTERSAFERVGHPVLSMAAPRLEGTVWRELRGSSRVGILMAGSTPFAPACREAALRLGLSKLVWIVREGGLTLPGGQRASFVHLDELRELMQHPSHARRSALLREIEAMLVGGVQAVNLCTLAGLHDELFTYDGSGTLFTEERYVIVRRLGIDDFDAASNLVARGTEEGYLAPRTPAQLDELLAGALGAFVEGYHLAGISALLVDERNRCGELASLYTLTRFVGEGVGAQIVTHVLARARDLGLDYVYACTTSERVVSFFERNGFRRVPCNELPASKWSGYDPARRALLSCLRRDLARTPEEPASP
jgi:amino-acid N-acetyltransferase